MEEHVVLVEKVDEPPCQNRNINYDYSGRIWYFTTNDITVISKYIMKNKDIFAGRKYCYKDKGQLVKEADNYLQLLEFIKKSYVDGDSEAKVQFLKFKTDIIPINTSTKHLHFSFNTFEHKYVYVNDDKNFVPSNEWNNDGVYSIKVNPNYVFDL